MARSLLIVASCLLTMLASICSFVWVLSSHSSPIFHQQKKKKHAMSILLTLYPKSNKITSKKKEWNLTLKLSSSFLRRSCRWRAWFSSVILRRLERIWDCTRASVCMHRSVLAAWRFTELPSIRDFNLTRPLKARKALLAYLIYHPGHFLALGPRLDG